MTTPSQELVKILKKLQTERKCTQKVLKNLELTLKDGADVNHQEVFAFMHSYPSRVNPKVVCLLVKYGLDINHIYKADSNETAFFWWMEQLNFGRGRSPAWYNYSSADEPIILQAVKCLLCEQTDWNLMWRDGWYKKHTIFDVLEKNYNRLMINQPGTEHRHNALDTLLDHIMAIESLLTGLKTRIKISLLGVLLQRKHPETTKLIKVLRDSEVHQYRKRIIKTFLKSDLFWLQANAEARQLMQTLLSSYNSVDRIQRLLKENYSAYDEARWQTLLNFQVVGLSNKEFDTHLLDEMARSPDEFQVFMNKLNADEAYQQQWQTHFKAQFAIDLSHQKDKDGLTAEQKAKADNYVKAHDYWDFITVLEQNYAKKLDSIRNISEFYELEKSLANQLTAYDRYIIREFLFRKGTSTSALLSSAWCDKRYSAGALEELQQYDLRYLQTGLETEGYEYHSMYGEHWYEEYSFKEDLKPHLSAETIHKLRELGHKDI